jgi:Zn-dependent protease
LDSLYVLPVLLFSIVVHEVSHGWVAFKLGDPTAHNSGRITFNPIPHIDPIGSVLVPLISYITAGSIFIAWAKPVPVNPAFFRNYRRDDLLVSAAGPLSNLLMAFCCTLLYILTVRIAGASSLAGSEVGIKISIFLVRMFYAGITLNLFLAVFNLIPVPPLDGSHILAVMLPEHAAERYRRIGFFGILAVILLMNVQVFRYFILSVIIILRAPLDGLIALFS